ncbi:MAG: queuosine precursor transporter, partial [Desulfohalobiaceae bacterium]
MKREGVENRAFILLCGLFTGSLVISSVLAAKIVTVFGITVPAGVLGYCLTFICTDVISEVWGRDRAREVVFSGFVTLVACLGLIQPPCGGPRVTFGR